MSEVNERAKIFRASARFYLSNRKIYEEYRAGRNPQQDDRLLSFIREDLSFVERSLDEIAEKCGTAARLIIYLLYVENRTQEYVTSSFGITRRQLQYALIRWMNTAFAE